MLTRHLRTAVVIILLLAMLTATAAALFTAGNGP